MTTIVPEALPFEQQIAYFRKKINLPTATYLDIYGEAHDYAFVVAGAHTHEIMADFRNALDEVIERGGTLEEFRKTFDQIVEKHSWQYNGGRNWRSRIIYDTNLYASYNQGRYQQQKELADVLPYWEYEHNDSTHPRLQHVGWDGLVLRADDPWWDTHYPIRAYGCHCTVRALDDVDLKHSGKTVQQAPEIEWEEKLIGQRSGQPRIVRVPKGVDPSFEHPKRLVPVHQVDKILMQKFVNTPSKVSSLMVSNILNVPEALKMLNENYRLFVDKVIATKKTGIDFRYVGVIPHDVIQELQALGKAPQSAIMIVRDEDIWHAMRDLKKGKNIAMPLEFWENIPLYLQKPKAVLLQPKEMSRNPQDPQNKDTLLFIYDNPKGKLVVKMDYDLENQEQKVNLVRTASAILTDAQWQSLKAFKLLWGTLQ